MLLEFFAEVANNVSSTVPNKFYERPKFQHRLYQLPQLTRSLSSP
jgi:hypothetical protein